MIIPLGSIIMPLIIMRWKKEFNNITKQIVSIQIIWTLAFPVIVFLTNILGDWFSVHNEIVPLGVLGLIITNLHIVITNTIFHSRKFELKGITIPIFQYVTRDTVITADSQNN